MKKKLVFGVALLSALFLGPLIAWAQQEVMITGQDSSSNTRAVRVDSTGRVITATNSAPVDGTSSQAHAACTNTALTIGTAATNIPASPRLARSFVTIELSQAGETLECEFDGTAVSSGTGLILEHRTLFTLSLAGNINASCLCSAASCSVRVLECP